MPSPSPSPSPSSTIYKLPPELILLIVNEVARSETKSETGAWTACLQALRCTCKALAELTAELLFKEVRFSSDSTDHGPLNDIAERPHLAKHVRHITYHPALFYSEFNDVDEFRDALSSVLAKTGEPPTFSVESLDEGYKYYEKKRLEQKRLLDRLVEVRDDDDDLQRLVKVLPKLTKVKRITISNLSPVPSSGLIVADQGEATLNRRIIEYCMSRYRGGTVRKIVAIALLTPADAALAGMDPNNLPIRGLVYDSAGVYPARAGDLFARAKHMTGQVGLTEIYSDSLNGLPFAMAPDVKPPKAKVLEWFNPILARMFSEITTLDLWYRVDDRSELGFLTDMTVGSVISLSCPNLKIFRFKTRVYSAPRRPRVPLNQSSPSSQPLQPYYSRKRPSIDTSWCIAPTKILGGGFYKDLEEVVLDGLVGHTEGLLRFLDMHRRKLRKFCMSGFAHTKFYNQELDQLSEDRYVDDGNWGECWETLRRMAEVDLNLAELSIWPTIPISDSKLRDLIDEMEPGGTASQDPNGKLPVVIRGRQTEVRDFLQGFVDDDVAMDLD